MRPDRNTLEVESTFQGEDVRMRIAEGAEAHIMSILTDMYEDRVLAQCREYATNAWDSHVEAGQTRPIEVTTPSALRPLFVVQDYGIGLDAEGIRRIYSQYGASTKRQTDEQTGMLGIGCKAALTYSDQFTVVGIKDKIKTTVSVSRDEDGAATMKILRAEPAATGEESGVTVQIPVAREDTSDFVDKATWLFQFWAEGTVLLNGATPKNISKKGYALTDSITVVEDEESDYLVMGNVPYPTDLELYNRSSWNRNGGMSVIAEVGIGALTFTPSREGLQDTARTQKCIATVKQEFMDAAKLAVQRDVDAAPDKASALTAYMTATESLPKAALPATSDITYQGDALPTFPQVTHARHMAAAGGKYSDSHAAPELSEIERGVWLTSYTNESFNKNQREKLIAYCEDETGLDEPARRPLFRLVSDTVPEGEWVPDANIVSWEDVKKWQPPLQPGQPPPKYKRTGIYYGYRPGASYVSDIDASEIPTDKRIYYTNTRKYHGGRTHKRLDAAIPGEFWFAVLPENRVKKFVKDFPKAVEAKAHLKSLAEKRRAAVTGRLAEAVHFADPGFDLDELDANKVHDPALKKMIGVAKYAMQERTQINLLQTEQAEYGLAPLGGGPLPELDVVVSRYPLLGCIEAWNRPDKIMDDLYLYINAAYAARQ
jgi:hypothetical protein